MLSCDDSESDASSVVGVWDFIDGYAECLSRSCMPFLIEEAVWNMQLSNLEFITRSRYGYLFWKLEDI